MKFLRSNHAKHIAVLLAVVVVMGLIAGINYSAFSILMGCIAGWQIGGWLKPLVQKRWPI